MFVKYIWLCQILIISFYFTFNKIEYIILFYNNYESIRRGILKDPNSFTKWVKAVGYINVNNDGCGCIELPPLSTYIR